MLPVRRKFLFSFEGKIPANSKIGKEKIIPTLSNVNDDQTDDVVFLNFSCSSESDISKPDVSLCGSETSRRQILRESTFAIVFVSETPEIAELNQRIYEALQVQYKNQHCLFFESFTSGVPNLCYASQRVRKRKNCFNDVYMKNIQM